MGLYLYVLGTIDTTRSCKSTTLSMKRMTQNSRKMRNAPRRRIGRSWMLHLNHWGPYSQHINLHQALTFATTSIVARWVMRMLPSNVSAVQRCHQIRKMTVGRKIGPSRSTLVPRIYLFRFQLFSLLLIVCWTSNKTFYTPYVFLSWIPSGVREVHNLFRQSYDTILQAFWSR